MREGSADELGAGAFALVVGVGAEEEEDPFLRIGRLFCVDSENRPGELLTLVQFVRSGGLRLVFS